MLPKIAACVVLYNPSFSVLSNVRSYYDFIDSLIVIDNSEKENYELKREFQKWEKVTYLFANKNLGIAKALNIAAQIALRKKYEWLLTMDQDSYFKDGCFFLMLSGIKEILQRYNKVGIIAPFHSIAETIKNNSTEDYKVIKATITSGNLLNLDAYKIIGSFEEKFFIDFVDHEYCLRLRKNNYQIIQNNKVSLAHTLGSFETRKILGKKIGISHHNYLRRYYMTRNSLYVSQKYFSYDFSFIAGKLVDNFIISPIYISCFENDKLKKLKSIAKGIIDFFLGRYGCIKN